LTTYHPKLEGLGDLEGCRRCSSRLDCWYPVISMAFFSGEISPNLSGFCPLLVRPSKNWPLKQGQEGGHWSNKKALVIRESIILKGISGTTLSGKTVRTENRTSNGELRLFRCYFLWEFISWSNPSADGAALVLVLLSI